MSTTTTKITKKEAAEQEARAAYEKDLKRAEVLMNKYAYQLAYASATTNAEDWWFLIDPRAFGYREVHGLKVEQAPPMNPDEFEKDIVLSVAAKEYGVAYVRDPRRAFFGYNS